MKYQITRNEQIIYNYLIQIEKSLQINVSTSNAHTRED